MVDEERIIMILNKGEMIEKRKKEMEEGDDKFKEEILFLEWMNYNWSKFSVEDKKYMKMYIKLMSDWFENK